MQGNRLQEPEENCRRHPLNKRCLHKLQLYFCSEGYKKAVATSAFPRKLKVQGHLDTLRWQHQGQALTKIHGAAHIRRMQIVSGQQLLKDQGARQFLH